MKQEIWNHRNPPTYSSSPPPHLCSFPVIRDVTDAGSSPPPPIWSAAHQSSVAHKLHRTMSTTPSSGRCPHISDTSTLWTTFMPPRLWGLARLHSLGVPVLEEAVEGQDRQGAKYVHDPVPQVHFHLSKNCSAPTWLEVCSKLMLGSLYPEPDRLGCGPGEDSQGVFFYIFKVSEIQRQHEELWSRSHSLPLSWMKLTAFFLILLVSCVCVILSHNTFLLCLTCFTSVLNPAPQESPFPQNW